MKRIIAKNFANPYLPLWEHLPDGEPRVFEDPNNAGKERVYVIGSHDVRFDSYCGTDIRVWSAPVEDLTYWRDEGSVFTYEVDGKWDVMYAPDLVEVKRKDGTKEYFLYPHSRGPGREAMVAKGSSPVGPFVPINMTEDGKNTVEGSILGFDPAIYIDYITDPNDPDYEIGFRAYGYWGFKKSYAAQLDQNTMYSIRAGTEVIEHFIPACSSYAEILDPMGIEYPHVFPGEDLKGFSFFEAASIRKIGNKYIWVYSGYSGPEYGLSSSNSTLRYAFGDTPLGPWKSGGVLVDSRGPVVNKEGTALQTSYAGHNTHGSIELIKDQWYVFYHRSPRGFGFARQPMVAPINVKWDEKPVSEGGRVTIRGWDTYASDNIWTAKAGDYEYTGAEVTSEGFNIDGLYPHKYYSAGIACYLSRNELQADSWDIWDDHMPIVDVIDGDIIGYKYFDINELWDSVFNLFLLPKTSNSFKISVWLDSPWDDEVNKGTKLCEIIVPPNAPEEITNYTAPVSDIINEFFEKGIIYLVFDGIGNEGVLCDLIGLGFHYVVTRPKVPTVNIMVDGKSIELPNTPVRSTVDNGITDYGLYETTITVPAGNIPVVTASSNDLDVKIEITQATTIPGYAIVTFDYRGVIKTYKLYV